MEKEDIAKWEELLDKVAVIHADINRELNKSVFPLGREEAARRLYKQIHNMTFIDIDHEPVRWWKEYEPFIPFGGRIDYFKGRIFNIEGS